MYKENKIQELAVNELMFLDFNRPTNMKQVQAIANSIKKFGILRLPVILKAKINGIYGFYILDGQHLIKALILLDIRITECIVVEVSNYRTMVDLVATLNNVQLSWKVDDYVHTYSVTDLEGGEQYRKLKIYKQATGFNYAVLEMILGNTGTIKLGTFKASKKDAEDIITYLQDICSTLSYYNAHFMKAFTKFYRSDACLEYEHDMFMRKLSSRLIKDSVDNIFANKNQVGMIKELMTIYNS